MARSKKVTPGNGGRVFQMAWGSCPFAYPTPLEQTSYGIEVPNGLLYTACNCEQKTSNGYGFMRQRLEFAGVGQLPIDAAFTYHTLFVIPCPDSQGITVQPRRHSIKATHQQRGLTLSVRF